MPKHKKYHFKAGFSQQSYIFEASKERFEHIANKFISYNDPSVAKEITGICLALSAAYLTQVREGGLEQGERYIKGIQSLVKVIDSETESYDPPYVKARHKARQLHAKQKLNLLFIDLIGRQRLSFDLYEMVNYQPSYLLWPPIKQDENIQDYFVKIVNFEANQNNQFVERFWFKELMIEIQRRINIHDNDLINFKLTVQRTYLDLKKKYLTGYVNYYNDRGLEINRKHKNGIVNGIKFEEFIKNYIDNEDINSTCYMEFSSENHMMAIVIEKNNDTGLLKYAFFDPNYGIIYFDERDEFKHFLTYIIKERQDIYSFLIYNNNTYITSIIELENSDVINKTSIFPTIERNLVNITTTKILCEEQSVFYLASNIKLLFKEFSATDEVTKIALIDENENSKIINLTVNSVDSDKILETITELYKNLLALDDNKIYLNIDSNKCVVSKVNYAGDSAKITEFLLENFPKDTLEIHKNESLGEDIAIVLDAWWDPKVNPEKIPSHSDTEIERLAETNYRHNLIIQLEGEDVVSESVANLISKHPEMTTVIQYDLENNRYRTVYGDVNKVQGERIRWFLIGHGRIDSVTKKRTLARKSAQDIADKLKYLKQTEFSNNDPEKIVLLGCKLGQGKVENNFALDISQQLWYEGFQATIIAYTQDLHICHNGRRIVYLNEFENSREEARYYKTIYNKEFSPMGIKINYEMLISYILREINLNNISLDSDIIKNSDYVKQYFYLPSGELDIDLLKLVAFDSRAYQLFDDYIYETRFVSGDFNVNGLLERLYNEKIFDSPLWKTVNNEVIQKNLYRVNKNNIKKIVFRFADEKKYRQQAELLASENPENTFIFQVDKNSNAIILEYGERDNIQNTTIDKWILLGDIKQQDTVFLFEGMTTENLADVMDNIHKQHLLAIPGEISFFNKNALGRLSNPYDALTIASQLAIKLAQKNITTNITAYQTKLDPFPLPSQDGVAEYFDLVKNNKLSKFSYDQASEQLFYNDFNISHALFMDMAKGNIDLEMDFESYPYYLNKYLHDQNGNLVTDRIKTIIYDPIVSRKVNNYFLRNIHQLPNAIEQWQKIFSIENNEALNIKIKNIDLLLENIRYRPEIVYYLSNSSKELLAELYSHADGTLDIASLMMLINEPQQLNQLHMSLVELAGIDERSGLNELPLQESLFRSQQWHQYYLNNIISLTKKVNQDPNLTIKPLSHAFYFEKNINLAKYIGIFYALTSNNTNDINRIWQYHRDLIEVSTKRQLSINEQQFLNNFNEVVDWIVYFTDNKSILYDQQNLTLAESLANDPIAKYQLSINHIVFTIIIQDEGYGYYQCKIFDPRMGEIKINQIAKENIDIKVISYIRNYLNSDIDINNKSYKRYELMGLEKDGILNYQFKLQKVSDNLIIKTRGKDLIDKIPTNDNIFESNVNINMGKNNISLLALQQAGTYIEDIPISSFGVRNIANWQTKIRFDVEQLNDYLTFFQGTKENIDIIKLISEKIKLLPDRKHLLLENGDLNDYSVAVERLTDIHNYLEPHLINRKLWQNLQLKMAELPRYAHILNKISNATQLTSIIQLASSTQTTLNYLNNPDISANERQQIEKSLIIAWSAGIANWGNEILQPLLLKAAYHMTGARYTANLFAARLSAGINIAASGFDLYYAYENFNQLSYETDPVIRQDLIVNGTLSLLGAGVSITSALTMLVGASSAGPVGIVVGTSLMLAGMFYNAYRTVERIKENVNLTAFEEFQTGFNAALGLQAGYYVRNKLLKQQTENAIKAYKIQSEKDLFTEVLKPAGYNLSIFVAEEEKIVELPRYHLFDKQTNLYLLKNKNKLIQYDLEHLKNDLNILTLSINLWKQQQVDDAIEVAKREFTAEEIRKIIAQYPERYLVEAAKIKTYIPINTQGENEVIMLSRKHDNLIKLLRNKPYLDNYIFSNANAIYSLSDKNQSEFIYESLHDYLMKGNLKKQITGINFNLANGDDVVVGLEMVRNRFISNSGHKIIIGGIQDDVFILSGEKIGSDEYKYFSADSGNDTLIITQLPRYYSSVSLSSDGILSDVDVTLSLVGSFINLEQGSLRFLYQPFNANFENIELLVNSNNKTDIHADLVSFENIIGIKNIQDVILANEKDNILNGNGGVDIIYGKGGKDTIILNNGYANGGEEQDTYIIERYSWNEYIASLTWRSVDYTWDAESEKWINVVINRAINNIDAKVIIDEYEFNAKSIVNLDYCLDEIKDLIIADNDISINISAFDNHNNSNDQLDLSINNINLVLKNAYKHFDNNNLMVNHEYILQTSDGFLLSMDLTEKTKISIPPNKIFDAIYISELDKNKSTIINNDIEINLNRNSIKNYRKNYLLPNMIKPLLTTHNADNSLFYGNDDNNQFVSIKNNSYINISHGIDTYIIDDLEIKDFSKNKSITFDFKEIITNYTQEDIIIIAIKNFSGHDFFFYENKLFYSKNDNIAEIIFINNTDDFFGKIYLVDHNNESFNIEYKNNIYSIKPIVEMFIPTDDDDNISYIKSNILQRKINALAGNDIITDMTELGNILIGGSGNDIITAKGGHNIIIDGEGNDIMSAGDGNDIIISTHGNNIISAGRGNNVIVINYNNNDIKVYLDEGENKIFIQGIDNIYRNEYVDDNLIISILDNEYKITIYNYGKYKNDLEINTTLNNSVLLNNQTVDLLISSASAFQHNDYEIMVANLDNNERDFINQIYQYKEMSHL